MLTLQFRKRQLSHGSYPTVFVPLLLWLQAIIIIIIKLLPNCRELREHLNLFSLLYLMLSTLIDTILRGRISDYPYKIL